MTYNNSEKTKKEKGKKAVCITELSGKDALAALMSDDLYCTTELPEYFDFSKVLNFAAKHIGDKAWDKVAVGNPEDIDGVNLDVITNKDGHYAVRPLTLANPFLYYMLARDICSEAGWKAIKECFRLFGSKHITACSIPVVKGDDKPEPFKNATSILNWWNSMEQRSIELSLKYRYMFITDITNCFGQINPESIAWALARKDTPHQTDDNSALASSIQFYLRAMQKGKNIGIPQGGTLFALIAEIVLGYTDMLLAQEIEQAKTDGKLPKNLEYEIIRYVDDYRIFCNDREALETISYMLQHILERFNFRMNPSKTRTSTELITDSIKPDKAFYIFNTPIESKQTYKDEEGRERKERGYDFDGFQKHLHFIYEFSRRFPNSGQLVRQLEDFSKRIEDQLSTKIKARKKEIIEIEDSNTQIKKTEKSTQEIKGHLWENIPVMVAIAVEIAANNLRAANHALKVASLLLADMRKKDIQKKKELIEFIYYRDIQLMATQKDVERV